MKCSPLRRFRESRFDYRSEEATLRAKWQQAGEDLLGLWRWVQTLSDATIAGGAKTALVGRWSRAGR